MKIRSGAGFEVDVKVPGRMVLKLNIDDIYAQYDKQREAGGYPEAIVLEFSRGDRCLGIPLEYRMIDEDNS